MHYPHPHLNPKSLSIVQRGAWGQFILAALLITILPSLILIWIFKSHLDGAPVPPIALGCAGGAIIAVTTLGYALLLKYPISIVRLRNYLNTLATGNIPDQVALPEDENDLAAVQHHLERVVRMVEERIQILEKKHAAELEVERQRVMVESIGAMSHHLGQPATVMSVCLYHLKTTSDPQNMPRLVADCQEAFDAMIKILDQLRTTLHYSSEPYLPASPGNSATPGTPEIRIIKV